MKNNYNSNAYRKSRMVALVRDRFTCQAYRLGLGQCEESRFWKLTIHHRKPVSAGGCHCPANLVTLCEAHHRALHGIN